MLVEQFMARCREQGPALAARLDTRARSKAEAEWQKAARKRWYALPSTAPERSPHSAFAVDGSGGTLNLNNGFSLVVAQAVLAGPTAADTVAEVNLGMADARKSTPDVSSLGDLMMRRLETQLALEAIPRMEQLKESTLLLDRSLHGELAHLSLWYGRTTDLNTCLMGEPNAPQPLENGLENYIRLLSQSCRQNHIVIGISKTIRARFLAHILEQDELPMEEGRPSDPELLYRWLNDKGYSHPILLGAAELGDLSLQPEAKDQLADCPAIVSSYVRPVPYDDPIRIDVPASAIGLPKRFMDCESAWVPDPHALEPIVALVRSMYGGPSVHNTLLYKVDRQVRLSRRTLEQVYLPALARVAGVPLAVDRSRRRFIAH